MKILVIEPYYTGSHKAWAEGYQKFSRHEVQVLALKGQFWKWRMHGGAVTLARMYREQNLRPDLILATDMIDLTTFLSLTRDLIAKLPVALYFHENQLSYPWSPTDRDVAAKRDHHYGFINYASALAADAILFNSGFHLNSFFEELPRFLKHFPDYNEMGSVEELRQKSRILHLGLELSRFDLFKQKKANDSPPLFLWNHRWEYDKNPESFFRLLYRLADAGKEFQVAILGENFSQAPEVFEQGRQRLGERIVQYGYAESFEEYARWLWRADLAPVTSYHDFFGASVVEAAWCGCIPLLPKRLAYPEIFDQPSCSPLFYENDEELFQKALQVLQHDKVDLSFLKKFDWEFMAPLYDQCFEELAG